MLRALVSRLTSIVLILATAGASNAPTLDAFLFHSRGKTPLDVPHFANGPCHAERCAIEQSVRESSPPAAVVLPLRVVAIGREPPPPLPPLLLLSQTLPDQNQSRAPPSFA